MQLNKPGPHAIDSKVCNWGSLGMTVAYKPNGALAYRAAQYLPLLELEINNNNTNILRNPIGYTLPIQFMGTRLFVP